MQTKVPYKYQLLLPTNPDLCPDAKYLQLEITLLQTHHVHISIQCFSFKTIPYLFSTKPIIPLLLKSCYFYLTPIHFFLHNPTPHFEMTASLF